MAVIADIIDERGNIYARQYVNIHRLLVSKTRMDVEVGVYLTEEQARNGVPPQRGDLVFNAPFDMFSLLNAWQQAYIAIKQRWPDSVDC